MDSSQNVLGSTKDLFFVPTIDAGLRKLTNTLSPRTPVTMLIESNPEEAFRFENAFRVSKLPGRLIILSDGSSGREYLAPRPYDGDRSLFPLPKLIFLDWTSCGPSGREIIHYLKSRQALKRIPVMSLSAVVDQGQLDEAGEAGLDGYFLKPADEKGLTFLLASIATEFLRNPTGEPKFPDSSPNSSF